MTPRLILDPAALMSLVQRQRETADALDSLAGRLTAQRDRAAGDWTALPAHADAVGALRDRLTVLAGRISAASTGVAGLADALTAHSAAVTEADTDLT
ncbi:hypothetical protein [Gordonia hirsuta]|nr:hypothetical protein [Gordonia hirsuta]